MNALLANFINYLFMALTLAIFGRVIISWVSPGAKDPLSLLLIQMTEPILRPIRQVVPPMGMFDLTPMIALIVLNIIRPIVVRILLPPA